MVLLSIFLINKMKKKYKMNYYKKDYICYINMIKKNNFIIYN